MKEYALNKREPKEILRVEIIVRIHLGNLASTRGTNINLLSIKVENSWFHILTKPVILYTHVKPCKNCHNNISVASLEP